MKKFITITTQTQLKPLNIKPLAIAKYFYRKGIFSHLVIQKLIYFAFLEGLKEDLLFFPEKFQAWKYGPVLSSVFEQMTNCSDLDEMFSQAPTLRQKQVIAILEKVYRNYHKWNVWDLVDKSHEGPWAKTRGHLDSEAISIQEIELKDLVNFANAQK